MTVDDALELIISRSPAASGLAIGAKRAIAGDMPTITRRIGVALKLALSDPQATFSPSERADVTATLSGTTKTLDIRIRVAPAEKSIVEKLATDAGFKTVSDFIRHRIGL